MQQDTEVMIVAKYVLTILTAKAVRKSVFVRMVLLVHPRMADAIVQQVMSYTLINKLIRSNIKR